MSSKYIPQSATNREFIAQKIRLVNGIRKGDYVRVRAEIEVNGKMVPRYGTTLKHKAEKEGWQILTEKEFADAVAAPKTPSPESLAANPEVPLDTEK